MQPVGKNYKLTINNYNKYFYDYLFSLTDNGCTTYNLLDTIPNGHPT